MEPRLARQILRLGKSFCAACLTAVVVLSTAAQVCAEADRAGPLAELLEAVNDREDVRGRRHHIQQLVKNLGEQVEQAIPVLRELLVEPEDHKRAGAALALGIIGPGAINSLPDLEHFLS